MCFDRVLIQGTLPSVCYAKAMSITLDSRGIRLFDYATEFAQPFREAIRAGAERVAADAGIEYIKKPKGFRKEDPIREIVAKRGDHPGLAHVFSVMELCSSYRPWHKKQTGMTYLRPDGGKCVYYYFYFIDEVLGLCFLSVPTWCPFRAQFYFNGHNWLASKLRKAHVSFELRDNAFARISDWQKAQELCDSLTVTELHARMDAAVAPTFPTWLRLAVIMEHGSGRVRHRHRLRSADDLAPLYDHLLRTAIHVVKFSDIATFLGRSHGQPGDQQIDGDFSIRIHATRVRHYLGPASINMYDAHGLILRVETTINDMTFFRHHRMVEQRDGKRVMKLAKSIYSLCPDLVSLSRAANDRYIQFLSAIDDPTRWMHQGALQDLRRGSKNASTATAASTSSMMRIRRSSRFSAEGST